MLTFETIEKRFKHYREKITQETIRMGAIDEYICKGESCANCELFLQYVKPVPQKSCSEEFWSIIRKRKLEKLLSHP